MATNLASLTPITTTATALSNLVLVTPQATIGYQPQNPPNADGSPDISSTPPPSLLFHYEGEQTVTLESDITDHFVEDNTAIQDQIALRPEMITTHGFIGELNDVPPPFLAILKAAAEKLTVIDSYTPELSETAQIAYAEAFQLYQVGALAVSSAVNAWNALSGSGGESVINGQGLALQANQNKQQSYFQQFYAFWKNRTLFTVQTPWAVFQNMAIKTLRAIQDAETETITDFELTFKMIRTASTQTSTAADILAARLNVQAATQTDLGTSTPVSSISQSDALTQYGLTV